MTLRTILGKLRLKLFRLLLGRDLFIQVTSVGKNFDLLRDEIKLLADKNDNLGRDIALSNDLMRQRFDTVDQSISSLSRSSLGEFRAVVNQIHAVESIRETHSRVFPKYRNIYRGRDIVLFGTGPTLKYYQPKDNCITLGLNSAVFYDQVKLDYLFVQDYSAFEKYGKEILDYDCKKFFGRTGGHWGIPLKYEKIKNVEIYHSYTINYIADVGFEPGKDYIGHIIPYDLSSSPISDFGSIAYSAMQFALWTHPKRIYLVGCDCSQERNSVVFTHFYENIPDTTDIIPIHHLIRGWNKIKEFQRIYYPDVEIVSVNPVFLKGMFKDEYTESYLADHPEIGQ